MTSISNPHQFLFTRQQLLRLLGVSLRQLRAWERAGWIEALPPQDAEGRSRNRQAQTRETGRAVSRGRALPAPLYGAADLLALKTLLRLRRNGVAPKRLRQVHAALKMRFAALGIRRPWSELRISGQDRRVHVSFQGTRMEPLTGQLLLDYTGTAHHAPISLAQRRRTRSGGLSESRDTVHDNPRKRAERFFALGLRLEKTPGGVPKAIRAYRRAIELNPRALGALLNLGTVYYNAGRLAEAESCYRLALQANPRSALAHFNMGNLADERGNPGAAIQHYEEAILLDSSYPDPRYNLALVFEKLGRHGQAWKHWRAYLRLDSNSEWAALARQKLAEQPWQLLRPPSP